MLEPTDNNLKSQPLRKIESSSFESILKAFLLYIMQSEEIKKIVETYFNIDLSIKSSLREYVYPKSILCYLLRQKTPLSTRKIANQIGYKSNQVVLYHEATIKANLLINKTLKKDIEQINKLLGYES